MREVRREDRRERGSEREGHGERGMGKERGEGTRGENCKFFAETTYLDRKSVV